MKAHPDLNQPAALVMQFRGDHPDMPQTGKCTTLGACILEAFAAVSGPIDT
ncbi:hypothetical protein OPKNFCMD_6785 [Methylobacterium crusticola]|uniref:Uncharacterized protein n=1 Tax=Methylobacterium crusticola TaxID=1697972 RepID=A0ABQ4R9Z6_9HYPH|nr:hypothetical protein OPKNFCMD_6785 [Methylobacterium crusticola]